MVEGSGSSVTRIVTRIEVAGSRAPKERMLPAKPLPRGSVCLRHRPRRQTGSRSGNPTRFGFEGKKKSKRAQTQNNKTKSSKINTTPRPWSVPRSTSAHHPPPLPPLAKKKRTMTRSIIKFPPVGGNSWGISVGGNS
jgi:hypothetical protein